MPDEPTDLALKDDTHVEEEQKEEETKVIKATSRLWAEILEFTLIVKSVARDSPTLRSVGSRF